MPASLWTLLRRENTARVRFQTECPDLHAISFRIDAEAVGNRQTRLAQAREIGRLWTKAAGVRRFARGERKYELRY